MGRSSRCSRRQFAASAAWGASAVALARLLGHRAWAQPTELIEPESSLLPHTKTLHHRPRAQAMISLFMQGGPSHLDLFDPKFELMRRSGQRYPGEIKPDNAVQASTKILGSPWKFAPCGESGMVISELLPHLAKVIDDVCLIRSMHTDTSNHGQSIDAMNTGRVQSGRPALGSWLAYGRGSENPKLPAFAVMTDPTGYPVLGTSNWSSGWLPEAYRGAIVRPSRQPAADDGALAEALDISQETAATHRLYGIDAEAIREFGTRLLVARRLVERGVRFVQVFTGNQAWDHHQRIAKRLPVMCQMTDQPSAALVRDLKERGLLETTLVHFGGEMGRLPVAQNDAGRDVVGRDHNTQGFSMWLAGGGIRGGMSYGKTDDFGYKAVEKKVTHVDYLATLLHLFGLDYKRLVYVRSGDEHSLIDRQIARVVHEIVA